MKGITIKALILGGLALAQAAWADVYRGTIGKEKVVMELITGDMMATGRFFTEREHKDRKLRAWVDFVSVGDTEKTLESLVIVPDVQDKRGESVSSFSGDELSKMTNMVLLPNDAEQRLKGVWREPNGTRLPVNLVRISQNDVASDSALPIMRGLKDVSLYDYLLLQAEPPEFLGERDMGEYRIAWWQNRTTRVKTFQLVSGYPAEKMVALNQTLQQRWWKTVLNQQVCVDNGGTLIQRIQITLLSASLVSYVEQVHHSDCGATIAYDDVPAAFRDDQQKEQVFIVRPYTLSTRTGKPVNLSQLFSIGETNAAGEYQLLYADFDRALPKWLMGQLQALNRDALAALPYPADFSPERWSGVSDNWFATAQGLRFYANPDDGLFGNITHLTHYQWAVLPWSFVNSHPAANVPDAERNLP
ncbi:hypothetical protein [Dickeya lacustris]|uniref:DUF3298 domain-containing protein n=1 Tax=Dickeya lacustris TaxID=2259638 RepID=A0ABY8G9I6_9GAMM|nr:hypothetical protein [Dickeya lacustris]WFN56641.1 hypothetical protein O1Q98_05020 [Dickeya lacustris]